VCDDIPQGDSGTLFDRMPEIQRTKTKAVGKSRGILLVDPTKIKYTIAYINETGRLTIPSLWAD
jgi:hypothetical protein